MSKIKAAKTLLKKATKVFPFVKGKVTGTKKAGELYQKGKGMIGTKIKKTTKTIKGINPRTKSRIGRGDVKVEDLSTIVDVKLPKEPAILRKTPSSFVTRRMTLGALGKKKK